MAQQKSNKAPKSTPLKSAPTPQSEILVDSGPLLALVALSDSHHAECAEIVRRIDTSFITTLPVFADAINCAISSYGPVAADALWKMVSLELIVIEELTIKDLKRIAELIIKTPAPALDFADASLIAVAEHLSLTTIFTVDRDRYASIKIGGKKPFKIIGP